MINYIEHMKASTPIEYFDLQPGSYDTSSSVEKLKKKFDFALLQPYFEFLSVYDVQGKKSIVDIYFGFFAMPAHEIVVNVDSLNEVRITCDSDYDKDYWTSYPENTV